MRLDQSGNHTEQALDNIKLLEDDSIRKKIFSSGNEEYEKAYFRLISLSYFHQGQGAGDIEAFREAYYYAKKDFNVSWRQGWIKYIEGTIAYFENDIKKLKKIIGEATNNKGDNKNVLLRLLSSLESGNDPKNFYWRAYGGLLKYKFSE